MWMNNGRSARSGSVVVVVAGEAGEGRAGRLQQPQPDAAAARGDEPDRAVALGQLELGDRVVAVAGEKTRSLLRRRTDPTGANGCSAAHSRSPSIAG